MSRDDAIVAWHEVPGRAPPQKICPLGYGVILAGLQVYARIDGERLWPYMGGIAKQNGIWIIPECLGSVSDHLHLCISQLQETVHPIEQQLEQPRIRTFQEEYLASFEDVFPVTSCPATIVLSLRCKPSDHPKYGATITEGPIKCAFRTVNACLTILIHQPKRGYAD